MTNQSLLQKSNYNGLKLVKLKYNQMKKLINLKVFSLILLHDEKLEVNGIKFIQPQSF